MIVTVDTNILFQALYSNVGASHEVLKMIRRGDVVLAISVPVFQEYRDVLSRIETRSILGMDEDDIQTIMQFVALVGRPTEISFTWRPNLQDEGDNMMVELARASGSTYLITRNTRDFVQNSDLKNDDLRIVTPAEFLKEWRETHGE